MTNNTSIVSVHDLEDAQSAGTLFKRAMHGDGNARAIVRQNPERALAALGQGDAPLGFTPKGSADALESIIDVVGNDDHMKGLLEAHLVPERIQELLTARGDLDAALANIAPRETLIAAIAKDVRTLSRDQGGGPVSDFSISLVLRGWAMKLRERSDYLELLQEEIADRPLLHWIVIAVWRTLETRAQREDVGEEEMEEEQSPLPEERSVSLDEDADAEYAQLDPHDPDSAVRLFREGNALLNELSIDPDEAMQLFQQLLENGQLEEMELSHLVEARRTIAMRREALETAPTELEQAREDVDAIVDSLDL